MTITLEKPIAKTNLVIKVAGADYDLTELDYPELDELFDLFITNAAHYTELLETASGKSRKAAIEKAIAEYSAAKNIVLAEMERRELEVFAALPVATSDSEEAPCLMPCIWTDCSELCEPTSEFYCETHSLKAMSLAMDIAA